MNHTKTHGLFITGTDTDAGKTMFATALTWLPCNRNSRVAR